MKIPGTHHHASIASIPTSKEYKEGWERTFHNRADEKELYWVSCPGCGMTIKLGEKLCHECAQLAGMLEHA